MLARVEGHADALVLAIRSSFLLKPSEVVKPTRPAARSHSPIGATAWTTTPPAGVR